MRHLPALLLTATLTGCLAPGQPPPILYYSAEPLFAAEAKAATGPELRLRRPVAASYIKERMVWRSSDFEYGFRELRRWTEPPVAWLERALASELFEKRGLRRSESPSEVSLDVLLVAFEEMLGNPHEVRVALVLRLTGKDGRSLLDRSLEARVPLSRSGTESVAAASAEALAEVVSAAADAVEAVL